VLTRDKNLIWWPKNRRYSYNLAAACLFHGFPVCR